MPDTLVSLSCVSHFGHQLWYVVAADVLRAMPESETYLGKGCIALVRAAAAGGGGAPASASSPAAAASSRKRPFEADDGAAAAAAGPPNGADFGVRLQLAVASDTKGMERVCQLGCSAPPIIMCAPRARDSFP